MLVIRYKIVNNYCYFLVKLKTLRHRDHDFSKIEMVRLEEKVSSVWNLLTTMLFKYLKGLFQ